jgi:hypothetical protein
VSELPGFLFFALIRGFLGHAPSDAAGAQVNSNCARLKAAATTATAKATMPAGAWARGRVPQARAPPLRKVNPRRWLRSAAHGCDLMQRERFGGGSGVVEDVAGEDAEVERADGGDA